MAEIATLTATIQAAGAQEAQQQIRRVTEEFSKLESGIRTTSRVVTENGEIIRQSITSVGRLADGTRAATTVTDSFKKATEGSTNALRDNKRSLDDSASSASGFGGALQRIGEIAAGIGLERLAERGFGALKDAVLGNVQAAFQYDAAIQQQRVVIELFTKSTEEADRTLRSLVQFANNTPLSLPGTLELGRDLLVAGVSADQLTSKLKTYGDLLSVTSGLNDDAVQRFGLVIQQISAAGQLYEQDANQLRNLNIPVYKALAEAYGITAGEAKKLASEGKISADATIYALERFAQSNAPDAMARAIERPKEALKLLTSNAEAARSEALEPLTHAIDELVVAAAKYVQSADFAKNVAEAQAAVAVFVADIREGAIPALKDLGAAFDIALKGAGGQGGRPDEFLLQVAVAVDALARIFATEFKLMIEAVATWVGAVGVGVRLVIDDFKLLATVAQDVFEKDFAKAQSDANKGLKQFGKDFSDFGSTVRLALATTDQSLRAIPDSFNAARADIERILAKPLPGVTAAPNAPAAGAAPGLGGVDASKMAAELKKAQDANDAYNEHVRRTAEDLTRAQTKLNEDYVRSIAETRSKLATDLVNIEAAKNQKIDAILDAELAERKERDRRIGEERAALADRLAEIEDRRVDQVKRANEQETAAIAESARKRQQIEQDLADKLGQIEQQRLESVRQVEKQIADEHAAAADQILQANRDLQSQLQQNDVEYANKYADIQRRRVDAEQQANDAIQKASQDLASRRAQIEQDLSDKIAGINQSTQDKLAGIASKYGTDQQRAAERGLTPEQRSALSGLRGEFGTDIASLAAALGSFTGAQRVAAQVLLRELSAARDAETKAALAEKEKQVKAAQAAAEKEKASAQKAAADAIKAATDRRDAALAALDKEKAGLDAWLEYTRAQERSATFIKLAEIQQRLRDSDNAAAHERANIEQVTQKARDEAERRANKEIAEVNRLEGERTAKHVAELARINDEAQAAADKAADAATKKIAEIGRVADVQLAKHNDEIGRILLETQTEKDKAKEAADAHIAELTRTAKEAQGAFDLRLQRAAEDLRQEYDKVVGLTKAYQDLNRTIAAMPPRATAPPGSTPGTLPGTLPFDDGGWLREPVLGSGLWTGTRYGFALGGPEHFGGVQRHYDGSPAIDYDRLALAMVRAAALVTPEITIDGQSLGRVNRRLESQYNLRNDRSQLRNV